MRYQPWTTLDCCDDVGIAPDVKRLLLAHNVTTIQ
jgi:hypothetical protein